MTDALQFEVKKDKWEQLQNGSYKLTVTMNPTDLTDNNDALLMDFIKCAPGSRFVLAAVRITDDEQPAVQKSKVPFHQKPRSSQVAIRCQEQSFIGWAANRFPVEWREDIGISGNSTDADRAERVIKQILRVHRKREIEKSAASSDTWDAINAQFEADTRLPEQR